MNFRDNVKININTIINIVGALLFVCAFKNHFFENDYNSICSVLNIFIFVAAFFIRKTADKISENRVLAYIFGTIYSIIFVFGSSQYWSLTITSFYYPISNLINNILYIVGFTMIISPLLCLLSNKLTEIKSVATDIDNKRVKTSFLVVWGVMFLSWLPCFLSLYPGVFSYDLPEQTEQVVLNTITRHHPPLHTLLWKVFLELEKVTPLKALPAFSIFQMIIVSFTLTYLCFYLIKLKAPKFAIVLSLMFFIVNPVVAIISILSTKDVFFAVFFIFTVIFMDRIFIREEKSKGNIAKLGVFILMSCLFRNNGVYALGLVMVCMLIFLHKEWKIIICSFLIPVVLFLLINGPVYSLLGFQEGTPKEKICIPMQ